MENSKIILARSFTDSVPFYNQPGLVEACNDRLKSDGWVWLRGFDVDLDSFAELLKKFCTRLTFDPARQNSSRSTQKVDAGTDAVGLHIENGNTPFPPDLVGFYCGKSASRGSQTTVCDGAKLYEQLPETLKKRFSQTLTVTRDLPEALWKRYAANEHPGIGHEDQVDASHLEQILSIVPNHRGTLNDDGSLHYELDIDPVIKSRFSPSVAFANAILGPSFNYQPPRYTFADGSEITEGLKQQLADLAEEFTLEVPWQDGDVVLIDNKRVMHGRRQILDWENRELYIGMGIV